LVNYATNHYISYRFVPNQFGLYATNSSLSTLAGVPMIEIRLTPLDGWGRIAKRAFDVLGSLAAMIILSPVLIGLAVMIKLREPDAPVIFKHRRLSRNGRDVYVLKFRTMSWRYSQGTGRP